MILTSIHSTIASLQLIMNDDGKGANLTKSTLMLVHTYMEVTYYSDSENSGVGAYIIGNLWFECFGVLAISKLKLLVRKKMLRTSDGGKI